MGILSTHSQRLTSVAYGCAGVGLVCKDSCWLLGGMDPPKWDSCPREMALCSLAVQSESPEVFVIQDLTKDPR